MIRVAPPLTCTAAIIALFTAGGAAIAAEEAPKQYWDQSTWSSPDRGFLWYGEPPRPPSTEKKPKAKRPEQMTNKELGDELQRRLDMAVQHQTTESVKSYLTLQQYAMDRASRFSDVFRRTVWTTPELDYSLRSRPTNALAIAGFDSERDTKVKAAQAEVARTHGLFFYFRANCVYCHQLAPILRMYSRNYGVEVFAVSMDGSRLAEFPDARTDNGSAQNLGITVTPAVLLANKETGRVQPIGFGVMSLDEIVNRVYVLTQTQPGQEY
jgi:conjugal transfer pilus assembly protein TraF